MSGLHNYINNTGWTLYICAVYVLIYTLCSLNRTVCIILIKQSQCGIIEQTNILELE